MIGYIYYILDLTNADMYIGSCWKHNWINRKKLHKLSTGQYSSKCIIDNNNYIFEILEENDFIDKRNLEKKEQYYIDNNNCVNKYKAYRTEKEKKEYQEKYLKQYRIDNSLYYKNYNKEYYKNNKEKLKEYNNKNSHKKYRKVCCIKCKKELLFNNLKRHNNTYH